MKRLLASLLLLTSSVLPSFATVYSFENFDYLLESSSTTPVASGNIVLGRFSSGFTPTASNLDSWSGNFISDSIGYYDGSGPEWSASLTLNNNVTFPVGTQLYVWYYNSLLGSGREWALLTDTSWKTVSNSPLALDPVFLDFSRTTTAVFGSINNVESLVISAPVQPAVVGAVPEPSTWLGVVSGAGVVVLFGLRRRARASGRA